MIVAEMRTGHVPMEVLRFQIKREHVREDHVERAGDIQHGGRLQVGRRAKRSDAHRGGVLDVGHLSLLDPGMIETGVAVTREHGQPLATMAGFAANGFIAIAEF